MDNPPKKKSQPKLAPYLSLSTNKTNNKHITTKESTEKQNIKDPWISDLYDYIWPMSTVQFVFTTTFKITSLVSVSKQSVGFENKEQKIIKFLLTQLLWPLSISKTLIIR